MRVVVKLTFNLQEQLNDQLCFEEKWGNTRFWLTLSECNALSHCLVQSQFNNRLAEEERVSERESESNHRRESQQVAYGRRDVHSIRSHL